MNKKKVILALGGLNNTDIPAPGVPFVRGLKESDLFDVRIIGLVYENLEPGIYLDGLCDRIFRIPVASAGVAELIQRLEEINRQEKIDVLVPFFDEELIPLMNDVQHLENMNIQTFLPSIEQFKEREKYRLPEFGKKYGIKVPPSLNLNSLGEITAMEEKFDYPVMVKGQFYDAYLAGNKEQMKQGFLKISSKWGLPIIAQEFVAGTEINVVALGDGNGNTVAAVPMLKQYITEKGKAWGGITVEDDKLMQLTHSIISQTKWRGGMELELIKTQAGEYYLIEINPRIPAWVYLAVSAGQNIPEAYVKLALGMEVENLEGYKVGEMFVRYSYDQIVDPVKFKAISEKGTI